MSKLKYEGTTFNQEWIKGFKKQDEFLKHPSNSRFTAEKPKELWVLVHGKKESRPQANPEE